MSGNLTRDAANVPPLVSVLVAVRDGLPDLRWTWNTLRRTARVPCEFVFVDDGSTDGTADFLAACALADTRVRVRRQAARGLVAALNLGLEVCRAEWVARVDADDLVHPERFERQLAVAKAAALDVVGTGIRCFPAGRVAGGLRRYEAWQNGLCAPEDLARERFVESPLVHPSVMFRRARVLAAGGYVDAGWPEDYDLWLRLLADGARLGKCPEILTYWRERPERLTRTAPHCSADAVVDCKVHHLLAGPLAGGAPVYVAGAGDDAKRLARRLARRGRDVAAFLDLNPRRIGQRIGGVPVCRLEDAALAPGDGAVILAAIGAAGRRPEVRAYFEARGFRECVDFWCVA